MRRLILVCYKSQVKHEMEVVKLRSDARRCALYSEAGFDVESRWISSSNRRAIVESPSVWANSTPSFSTSIARAMLPLPMKVPALRKMRAYLL